MERNATPRYNGRIRDVAFQTVQTFRGRPRRRNWATIENIPMRANIQDSGRIAAQELYDVLKESNKNDKTRLGNPQGNDTASPRPPLAASTEEGKTHRRTQRDARAPNRHWQLYTEKPMMYGAHQPTTRNPQQQCANATETRPPYSQSMKTG